MSELSGSIKYRSYVIILLFIIYFSKKNTDEVKIYFRVIYPKATRTHELLDLNLGTPQNKPCSYKLNF